MTYHGCDIVFLFAALWRLSALLIHVSWILLKLISYHKSKYIYNIGLEVRWLETYAY